MIVTRTGRIPACGPSPSLPSPADSSRTTSFNTRSFSDSGIENLFRTGTVLRAARTLPATALLVLTAFAGLAREAAESSAAEPFADYERPGAIGVMRAPQPGPRLELGPYVESVCPDTMQPVEIRGPEGMLASIETASGWSPLRPGPLRVAVVVGAGYRLRIGGGPGREGEEFFPSVRVLAKLATPPGQAWRFPVEITIDEDDLRSAAEGALVRRVVYASCEAEKPDILPAAWFDVKPGDDALEVARTLGDPVAEIVIGNRLPASDAVP